MGNNPTKKPTKRKKPVVKQHKNNEGGITGKGWKPGISGNPNGRPKKSTSWSEIANDLLDSSEIMIVYSTTKKTEDLHIKVEKNKTIRHAIVSALINEAMSGNIQAIKELYDRTEGKPAQKLEVEQNILPTGFDIGLIKN